MIKVINKIKNAKSIALFTHKNADPDALGSVGAFLHAMKGLNKKVVVCLNEKPDNNFDFLNLENVVFEPEKINKKDFDLFVSMDSASLERLGVFKDVFKGHKNTIEIDHHKNRQSFAKDSIIKFYSSNTEILLELFEEMLIEVSPHVASCLYTGLVGDTDGFKNGSTTELSHKHAHQMILLGADISLVNASVFLSKDKADILIIKKIIERAEFKDHIAISYITEKDSKELGKDKFLTSDLVNLIGSIKGVEISVLVKQDKGKNYRISLRSTKNYNVGEFASRFGGGGHNQASGMALVGSLKQVKDILIKGLGKLERAK